MIFISFSYKYLKHQCSHKVNQIIALIIPIDLAYIGAYNRTIKYNPFDVAYKLYLTILGYHLKDDDSSVA